MQIAAEHAEAVGERARVGVEERLLLDRIALHAADVAPRHAQRAAVVEPHLAHAHRAVGDRALMTAGMTAQTIALERLDELGRRFVRALGEQLLQLHVQKCDAEDAMSMPQVVVVGAGVFGTWTAHHLVSAGCRVTLVDAYGPANPRASSSDQSRILRCGYGADEIYSGFARRSVEQWRALQERASVPIWHPCGVLLLADAGDPYAIATRHTLEHGGYAVEVLAPSELRNRYPHLEAERRVDGLTGT